MFVVLVFLWLRCSGMSSLPLPLGKVTRFNIIFVREQESLLVDSEHLPGTQHGGSFSCRTSWLRASLMAQWVKNLPAMQGALVRFLGLEDPLEKG